MVYRMWGPQVVSSWNAWRDPVVKSRELGDYRDAFKYFERLALIMGAEMAKEEARDAKEEAKNARKAARAARD